MSEFHINESFDDEGNIQLKFDDIYRGLDAVIHKKFKEKIEREKGIASILKLKPLTTSERIEKFFRSAGYEIFCFNYNREFQRKASKILEVTNQGLDRDFWKYNIQFENGDEGSYQSKFNNQHYFEVGETTSYIFDKNRKRVSTDNGSQITITPVDTPNSPGCDGHASGSCHPLRPHKTQMCSRLRRTYQRLLSSSPPTYKTQMCFDGHSSVVFVLQILSATKLWIFIHFSTLIDLQIAI